MWNTSNVNYEDYWIQRAIDEIYSTYGDVVSVVDKKKSLIKFGRCKQVQTTKTTIMTLPTGIFNETYISTNDIDTLSSTNVLDTQELVIEGHTRDGYGDFHFVIQTKSLNGQNKVVLDTPLARITRMYNNASTDLQGTIYGYQDDTIVNGVPQTDTKVHIMIEAGVNNTEKASTTISNNDYWIILDFYADCLEKTASFGIVHLEIRQKGKVFRNILDRAANDTSPADRKLKPYVIGVKNSDVRLRVSANAAGKDFSGGIVGILAKVI